MQNDIRFLYLTYNSLTKITIAWVISSNPQTAILFAFCTFELLLLSSFYFTLGEGQSINDISAKREYTMAFAGDFQSLIGAGRD